MSITRAKGLFAAAISLLCAAAMLMPAQAFAVVTDMCDCGPAMLHRDMLGHTSAHVHGHDTDRVINDNDLNHVTEAGTYFLAGDQALAADANKGNQMWVTPTGETVIWTDGHDISIDATASQYMTTRYAAIWVRNGSTLTLSGCRNGSDTTPSKITGNPKTPRFTDTNNNPRACAIFVSTGGTLNIYGIDIAMTSSDTSGIVVEPGGTVNIYDSARNTAGGLVPTKIEGNSRYGIENMGGTVNIYGGTISGNSLGGVYAERGLTTYLSSSAPQMGNAIVNMYGGTISGNPGGGVRVDDTQDARFFQGYSAALNLYGGTITGNGSNDVTGGGIYVSGDTSSLTLHGEALGQDIAKGSIQPDSILVSDNFGGTGPNLYVNNTSDDDPRITVTPGERSVLRAGSSIGIATAKTVSGETDDDVITTNCPESARFFYSEVSGYVTTASADDTRVSLFKIGAQPAPVQAKSELTGEYTGKAIEASEVDDGTTVKGTWSWKDGKSPKDVDDSGSFTAVFTPANTDRYEAVEQEVQVTITPRQLKYQFTSLPSGMYGEELNPTTVELIGSPLEGDEVPITVTYEGDEGTSYGPSTEAPHDAGDYKASASTSNTNYRLFADGISRFSIAPAMGEEPDVTATAETIDGKGDGKINGLTTEMEISTDGETYNAVTDADVDRDYAVGTYYVRAKENPNYLHNPAREVTVDAGRKLTVTVPADQVGYELTADPTELSWHGESTVIFTILGGYTMTDAFRIYLNGTTDITEDAKSSTGYRIANMEDDATVTVEGVEDVMAPDVSISMRSASWQSFVNKITFGLFFKEDQDAVITVSDGGSGLKTAEYLLRDSAFASEDEVKADTSTWTPLGDLTEDKAIINLGDLGKKYLYVRAVDNVGNVKVASSDGGVVIYRDSAANSEEAEFTKASKSAVTVAVDLNGNGVKEIRNGDDLVPADAYTVNSDAGLIVFDDSYLDTLAAGSYTFTISYDPQGERYRDYEVDGRNINDAPATTSFALEVLKHPADVNITGAPDKTYDALPADEPTCALNTDATAPLVEYKVAGADDSTYTATAPTDAGDYTVRVSVPETNSYTAASSTADFTISPKEVAIENASVEGSKVYDATTAVRITDAGEIAGVCGDDEVAIVPGTAAYADKNAGSDKAVSFSGFAIAGASAANYRLAAQPASTTADIEPAPLTVELAVKDKLYDGTTAASYDGDPALVGVIEGDDAVLDPGTPSFAQAEVGEDIDITFTPFTLTGADAGNYAIVQPSGVTASIMEYVPQAGVDYVVNSNDWIPTDFVVKPKPGNKLSLDGGIDGDWVDELRMADETADGVLRFYVKDGETGALSVEVTERYKIDKSAPTGEASLAGLPGVWSAIVDPVSFDRFTNADLHLNLEAEDALSGLAKTEYHVADVPLAAADVEALGDDAWAELPEDGIVAAAEDGKQAVVYVRLTDNVGNRGFLSTDGVAFDLAAPQVSGVEDGASYYTTQKVAVSDANLLKVTLNGEDVTDQAGAIALPGNRMATYTIEATDRAGNLTTVTVGMAKISSIVEDLDDIDGDDPKPGDREKAEDAKEALEGIDTSDATDEEKAEIEKLIRDCDDLIAQIDKAEASAGSKSSKGSGDSKGGSAAASSGSGTPLLGDTVPVVGVAVFALLAAGGAIVAYLRRKDATLGAAHRR